MTVTAPAQPMSATQVRVVCLAILLSMLDGFDLLGMAFVAPAIGHEWALSKATLGFLLSTSLIGMAIGSLFLSPVADTVGRKPMVLGAISLMIAGSLLSAFCHAVPPLAACRILTGIGMGTMVPLTTAIASEFSSTRMRPFAISASTVGLPAGSILGGLVASSLLKHVGWYAVFVSGAAAGLLLLPAVAFGLQESPAFLAARRGGGEEGAVGRSHRGASYRALFAPDLIGTTLRLLALQILVTVTAYFFFNWLPQLVVDLGFPPATGSLVSAISSAVGVLSGLTFGALAIRGHAVRLASAGMIGFGLTLAAFGHVPAVLGLVIAAAAACNLFLNGATGIFFTLVAAGLPTESRVSGLGFIMGVGRVFSVAGPAVAGRMFASGLGRVEVTTLFGCAPIVAGVLLLLAPRRQLQPVLPAPTTSAP